MSNKSFVVVGYPQDITIDQFKKAEELMKVKLPCIFYNLIKEYDRGRPKNNEIKLIMPGQKYYDVNQFGAFLSFNPRTMSYIVSDYLYKPEHQPQDERYVAFGETGNGDKFFFFYENGKDDPQPKVYYWAHEYSDIDGGLVFLANSFEEFLDMLKPDGYYTG
ncbi:SMI1/KNR4 family protein [Candidatus Bodocaedibacter vickermanii]|uniref:Antitoxin with SUKH family nuclease toxin immunity domain n=1 Tax=Candidatus Bodocaedibacter vickermanii TaxID=2741701 RepID=A0A7L9RTJ5_9PROT|nr:Putative antitoxin with SUKH family nuclease toxin immunity domain [Candidatus Paracaedibacteraceae bacterium 'Lake Konstanz']